MLWITCPFCGHRPIDEFKFGGEIPAVPASITDDAARDVDRVWMFNNVDGITTERWFHEGGCRRWMTLKRDTHVDRILED